MRGNSLRFLLIALFGLTAAALVGMSGVLTTSAWQQEATAERRAQVSSTIRYLFQAMQNLRIERGTVSTALLAADPVDQQTWRDISDLRRISAQALAGAFDKLSRLDVDPRDLRIEELHKTVVEIDTIRARVDEELRTHRAANGAELDRPWIAAVGGLVDKIDELTTRLSSQVRLSDPFFDQMMTVKDLAWSVRSDAGIERLMIANAIASGEKPSDDWQRKVFELRGRVGAAWALLLDLTKESRTPQSLVQAIGSAKERYFDRYNRDRDSVYSSLVADGRSPMTGSEWIAQSNPALQSLMAVANTAIDLAQARAETASAEAGRQFLKQSLSALTAVLICVIGLVTLSWHIVRPIVQLTATMKQLAAGSTGLRVPCVTRSDELGEMAKAVEVFKRSAIENARLHVAQQEAAARTTAEKRAAAVELARAFNAKVGNLIESLSTAAREMESTARTMTQAADEAGQQATVVTSFAEQTSTNVHKVAVASDRLAASAHEIEAQVSSSAALVGKAVANTQRTDGTVKILSDRSERIDQILQLISDIAAQTNLLALNATIEAARAGDAGRGFGVVALEVKNLAIQTAKATEEIAVQITQSQDATREAVAAIREIGHTIEELQQVAMGIATAVEEQHVAAQEIARSVAEAAHGTQEVSNGILQVKQATAGTGSASSQVLIAASALSHDSATLSREVEQFLASVAAA
jgi:methyl-accepting chemotaxis protein